MVGSPTVKKIDTIVTENKRCLGSTPMLAISGSLSLSDKDPTGLGLKVKE